MPASDTAETFWFLNSRVTVRVARRDGGDGMTVLEHAAPFGDSPPLHVHRTEDEVFHVIAGELRCVIGGRQITLRAGDTAQAPKGVAHTYAVTSQDGARWLTMTCGGDFERLVRALAQPAERDGLPPRAGAPTSAEQAALAAACFKHGVELIGPPLAVAQRGT